MPKQAHVEINGHRLTPQQAWLLGNAVVMLKKQIEIMGDAGIAEPVVAGLSSRWAEEIYAMMLEADVAQAA